jgi:hypothetical protein
MARKLIICLIAAVAIASTVPAVALASGPSAGDQQYVDPLAGSNPGSTHSGGGQSPTAPSSTSSAPASTPTSSAASSSASSASSTGSSTTTTGTSTGSTSQATSGDSLPVTGYDAPLAVLTGFGLLALGTCLRRATRRA